MIINRTTSLTLAGAGLVLMIGAHGLVAWGGIALGGKIGGSLPWIAGGALAFGLYHVLQAFGLYHVVQHVRGKGHSHSRASAEHALGREDVERGPRDGALLNLGHGFVEVTICDADAPARFRLFFYDKQKQPRALPRNATVTIETVRPADAHQTFELQVRGDYLESTTDVPKPHEFKAIVRGAREPHPHSRSPFLRSGSRVVQRRVRRVVELS